MIYFQTEFDVVVVVRQLIRRTDCEPVSHSTQWLLEGFNFRRNGGRAGFVVVIATPLLHIFLPRYQQKDRLKHRSPKCSNKIVSN